mgnify:FL=1|jgi:hypothetical protein|tara:strand:- start:7619 stop:8197 length:579 start_codon:yes stop_codon:yes gene_type:complete
MRLRSIIVLALVAVSAVTWCPTSALESDLTSTDTPPDFPKLKIASLRAILDERGLECRGCAEKADFVTMARDNYHLPIVEKKSEVEEVKDGGSEDDSASSQKAKMSDAELEEMMRSMGMSSKANTGDPEKDKILNKLKAKGINIAGANGMAGMDIEQLRKLEQAMGGMETGVGRAKKKKKRSKDDDVPTEEL